MMSVQRGRSGVVLVVDDEVLVRMVAAECFAEAGYEVVEAADGAEALRALRERPDIRAVFTDVQMPGQPDGLELARSARDVCPDCAVVVVSGRAIPQSRDLAENVRFLPKPYDGDYAVQLVNRLLNSRS